MAGFFLLCFQGSRLSADRISRSVKDSFIYESNDAVINLETLDNNDSSLIDFSSEKFSQSKLDAVSANKNREKGDWLKLLPDSILSDDNQTEIGFIRFSGRIMVVDRQIYLSEGGMISADGFEDAVLAKAPLVLSRIKFRGVVEVELNAKIKDFVSAPDFLEGTLYGISQTRMITLSKKKGRVNFLEYYFDISPVDFDKFSYLRISEKPRFGLSSLSFPLSDFRKNPINLSDKKKKHSSTPSGRVTTQVIRPRFDLEVTMIGPDERRSPDTLSLFNASGDSTQSKLYKKDKSTWVARFFLLDWRDAPFRTQLDVPDFSHVSLSVDANDRSVDSNGTVRKEVKHFVNQWKTLHINCSGVENASFVRIKPSSFISMHFDSQQRVVPLEEGRYAKIDNLMDPLGGGLELLDEKKQVIWPDSKGVSEPWHKLKSVDIEPVARNEYEARVRKSK